MELARVKEHLRRVRQAVEVHRKLGEDTAFDLRELKRDVEKVKKKLPAMMESFDHLADQARIEGSEFLKELLKTCEELLQELSTLITNL